ncbi:hypothetical protein L226DRAFT_457383 [Lentinus tigrinus ALCF2SS1-7]|uniref:Zn(2)-C6 fungal-type domain-containing protein n=1 Tax=Lentinus tigrinus ALCF2SS1-6 TaxID=1328759 RepID=A0A5C2S4X8_9APHY|nr:hypothetical protein L227DRAFT_505077 [Lentinus tigrinus ALCF2SS1-6]RPD78137.1 hypothetical protein L226DRAFT_457383 [Lentinus tigrinus ALCF2SS1-7]
MAEERKPTSSTGPAPLQRGKACLRCRKRKMRCDGTKPACAQCVRAKKADACEYDDGKGKTRTQLMREHIARLEMRVKELENPEQSAPSMTLFDPHAISPYYSESSSGSSYDSPGKLSYSASASPTPFPLPDEQARRNMLSPLSLDSPEVDPRAWEHFNFGTDLAAVPAVPYNGMDAPPLDHILLEIFIPHRHQCGLDIHVGRLRDSLALPASEQRHPVLMNAICLWACYLSRPGSLSQYEQLYLSRSTTALADALQYTDKAIDVIQACCLLSVYYISNGRLFEGSYYSAAASALAIQCRLHQIGSENVPVLDSWDASFDLPPPKDSIERGERISTFWQVYNLDRCWSVMLRRPATLPDSDHPWASITTPWPQRIEDYENGDLDIGGGSPTIRAFFVQQPQSNSLSGFSTLALRAKVSTLYEGANRLSSSWSPRSLASGAFSENFSAFEHSIIRFTTTLVPLHQVGGAMPDDKYALIVIHSLAHASMIRLHAPFMRDDTASRDKCLRAARSLIHVTKLITDADFELLDPVIGCCWASAAKVLEHELSRLQSSWPDPLNTMEVRGDLEALLYVMTKLGAKFPLLAYHSAKVQSCLDGE